MRYLDAGRDMVASLQYGAHCPCGYCHVSDVESHDKEDHMESFFLAETVKYLWLLFDLAVGPDNMVENGPYKYIFTTEGHMFPMSPEISLVHEHCRYLGAFCKHEHIHRSIAVGKIFNHQALNDTSLPVACGPSGCKLSRMQMADPPSRQRGSCPGLMHEQKYGITFDTGKG